MNSSPAPDRREHRRRLRWALLGGAAGFVVASAGYLLVTPVLEASSGLLRELQGLAWNLVPGLTVVGCVIGWLAAGSRTGPLD